MQRNENKLEKSRKREEEIDKRLQEAGMYEDGLSQDAKAQLLAILEESCDSARKEEELRQNRQRHEQEILETLCESSTQKEGGGSSSNSRCRKEEVDVEAIVVSVSPAQHTQQEAELGPSATPVSDVTWVSSPRCSVIKSSSDHVVRQHTQAEGEDEDLFLLTQEQVDDPECQVIKTSTENSLSTAVDVPQSVRRKCHENDRDICAPTPNHPCPSTMAISPVSSKGKMTQTITSTVMTGGDSDTKTGSPIHGSPKVHHKRLPSPRVLLVPLPEPLSPKKNATPSPRKDLTSAESTTPTKKNVAFSQRKNASPQNSTITENSPSRKNFIPPKNLSQSSGSTATLSPGFVSSSKLSPSGTFTSSKDASTHSPSKKSGTLNFSKNSATPSIRKNLVISLEDSGLSRNCTSVSDSSGASITTSTSSTITTTITTTTAPTIPTHALSTSTTSTSTTSDKEVEEPENPPDASPESDLENKITLRTAVLRSINVFSRNPAHEVILRRKRPFPSEAADKCFFRGPNESPQQCRERILTLMDNMALRLQQHLANLPVIPWPPPLTVDWRLKDSLDRSKPASRRILQCQELEEEMEMEEPKQQYTRQAARCSRQEALKPLPDPNRDEVANRVCKPGQGRTLGLRRGKRPAFVPLPKITSDSDTDMEIGSASPPLPSTSRNSPLSCLLKAESTVLCPKSKTESQPQERRKTFRLDSGSESSDNEYHVQVDVARADNHTSVCVSPGRNTAASPTDPLSELCIIEEEQLPKLSRPAIRRVARRGTRRPAPEPTGSAPSKLRKTHTLNREEPDTGSIPEQTTQLSPDSSDSTPTFEDGREWNSERRQNQEEEKDEEEEKEKEEKMPCPICLKLYPLQEIQMHASDCMEDSQQQQQQSLTLSPRRLRRMNEEAAPAIVSSSEKSKECNKKQGCSLCKKSFNNPEDLTLHIQSCHPVEDDDEAIFCSTSSSSSSSVCQTNRRKVNVFGRALRQNMIRGRGGLSQPENLLANMEDKHSSIQP